MFQEEYKVMAAALQAAKDVVLSVDNAAVEPMKFKIIAVLTKEITNLLVLSGADVTGELESVKLSQPKPLEKFLGKAVSQNIVRKDNTVIMEPTNLKEFTAKQKTLSEDGAVGELRARVEALYPQFRTMDTASILDSYDELTIKGVAKYAGLPVSDNTPKKVDSTFVDFVKDAIRKKQELENEGKTLEETL